MTPQEAIEETRHLKGLFSFLSVEEMDWWKGRLQRFESPATVRRAVDRYAEKWTGHVDRGGLIAEIENEIRRHVRPRADPVKARAEADAHWAEVDRTLAALDPEQMERLRAVTLSGLPDASREIMAARDPARSRVLRAAMFERLKRARESRGGRASVAS